MIPSHLADTVRRKEVVVRVVIVVVVGLSAAVVIIKVGGYIRHICSWTGIVGVGNRAYSGLVIGLGFAYNICVDVSRGYTRS